MEQTKSIDKLLELEMRSRRRKELFPGTKNDDDVKVENENGAELTAYIYSEIGGRSFGIEAR